jgi:hypothetical protein
MGLRQAALCRAAGMGEQRQTARQLELDQSWHTVSRRLLLLVEYNHLLLIPMLLLL